MADVSKIVGMFLVGYGWLLLFGLEQQPKRPWFRFTAPFPQAVWRQIRGRIQPAGQG